MSNVNKCFHEARIFPTCANLVSYRRQLLIIASVELSAQVSQNTYNYILVLGLLFLGRIGKTNTFTGYVKKGHGA